jgi:exportin-5
MSAAGNVSVNGVQLLPHVLEKIFSAIVFPFPPNESPRTSLKANAVKTLRRHAASSIVKISLKYPLLLLPIFEQINTTVKSLCVGTDLNLSNMEKLLLQEALLIISNHFCEFERQQMFVSEIIRPAIRVWQEVTPNLKSPIEFIDFVGLSVKPEVLSKSAGLEDVYFKNRQSLLLALNTVLSVIKRCQCPDDPDKSCRGGFVVATTDSGNPITRNPAAPHVIPLLQHILTLLRCLNELYNPSAIARIHDGFKSANSLLEVEKRCLLGVVYAQPDPFDPTQMKKKTPLDHMQQYMSSLFDNCYHLMGAACSSLGRDLYGLDGLATALINSCFSNLENVPDFRLRIIIRVFLRPFIYSCPTIYHSSVIVPIFQHIAPFSELIFILFT